MNTQHTLFYDGYYGVQRLPTAATAKARAIPRDKVLTERTNSYLPLTGIVAYLLGLAAVAVTVVSGQFPWFLTILTVMLVMSLLFPWGHRAQTDDGH